MIDLGRGVVVDFFFFLVNPKMVLKLYQPMKF